MISAFQYTPVVQSWKDMLNHKNDLELTCFKIPLCPITPTVLYLEMKTQQEFALGPQFQTWFVVTTDFNSYQNQVLKKTYITIFQTKKQ